MIGVTISRCLSHFPGSLIVHRHIHILHRVWTPRRSHWLWGTLQSGVSGLSGSVRLRSVSLISGCLVQDISMGHQRGLRWLCSVASSYTEPVTLLFYSTEGCAPWLCCLFPITVCGHFQRAAKQRAFADREVVS